MKSIVLKCLTAGLLLVLGACASQPQDIAELDRARMAVASANQLPLADPVASAELEKARLQLDQAENALNAGDDVEQIKHHAYLATRYAEIVQERALEKTARDRIARSEAERNRVLLMARTDEAERAKQAALLQSREAAQARDAAAAALAEAREMERQLQELQAERTARGVVLTLSDVLFETDRAELLAGAYSAIDRIVEFLQDNPERRLLIEGHTDSTGAESYNEDLSRRRAEAVRAALIERGIARDRLETRGLGEAYPVASNDTAAGRQQNRRVEIVVSDKDGEFPDAARR